MRSMPAVVAPPARPVPPPAPVIAPPVPPAPVIVPPAPRLPARPRRSLPRAGVYALLAGAGALALLVALLAFTALLALGNSVLPGVSMAGVRLGGQSAGDAARLLRQHTQGVAVRSQDAAWEVPPAALGLTIDIPASVERAFAYGRSEGDLLNALLGRVEVAPVVSFDIAVAEAHFIAQQDTYNVLPVNAGVALVDGQVVATPPRAGALLDIQATLARLQTDPAAALASGLDLVTTAAAPQITDASAAVEAARALLANPLEIRVYDPVTDNSLVWAAPPEQWGQWLSAVPDSASPIGLSLSVQEQPLRDFLMSQSVVFDASRQIDVEAGVASLQAALAAGDPRRAFVVVRHLPRTHVVQSGETLTSIAWGYGIPYPYIQQANGGRDRFSVGESIVIPPADAFLLRPVVPGKRIVVSIPQQRVRVYENGALIQDWAASTGIADSPTWPGVYQVISREINAYAGNWNLYMPYFIGVYQPIPGADFTNGFHGFPTRGGGQILWENSLGTRVTYGCILVNNTNARWLYEWAEDGVVVVIEG